MKRRIINSGIAGVGLALVPTIAVSLSGSKSLSVITCAQPFPGLPGMTAEDNTPLQKTGLLDTQVDGGVRKLNPTPDDNTLEDNFGFDGHDNIAGS